MKVRVQLQHGANLVEVHAPLRVRRVGDELVMIGGPAPTPLGQVAIELTLTAGESAALAREAGKAGGS